MPETVRLFPEPEHPTQAGGDDAAARRPLQIGDWRFDPALNRLTRGDEAVRLEPKLADLLLLLAGRRGDVVSKEEIVQSVWEGRFIADSALTRAMAELRRALGDDAQRPIYIETISKRGYRMIAETGSVDVTVPRRVGLRMIVAAALLVLVILLAGRFLSDRGTAPGAAPTGGSTLVVLPLEDLSPGDPDGQETAYFAPAMTDALATDLARVGAFRVISQRSLDEYAESRGSLRGAAASLGADAAVEGSIVRAGGRVRINAQLTDAASETVLWADSYERELIDILALQREVARAIVTALEA